MRVHSLTEYDGIGDPEDHLDKFLAKADLLDMSDVGYCKIFHTTLAGKAIAWFNQLPTHTIENFEQLSQRFLHHFFINKRYPKTASYLFTMVQQEQENLRDYVQRCSEAVSEVPHLNHELKQVYFSKAYIEGDLESLLQRLNEGPEEGENSIKREKGKENLPTARVIGVVTGGPAGGDLARAQKALVRAASSSQEIKNYREVTITGVPKEEITFSSNDLERGVLPHNDAMVISAALFLKGIGVNMLTKVNTPLVGFNGSVVEPLREIALPISIWTTPHRATRKLKFLIVDIPSSYNVIMGRPSLNSFRAVASIYHMKLRFPTYGGMGEEKGDRRLARECHANIFKKKSNPYRKKKLKYPVERKKNTGVTRDHALPPLEQQMKKRKIEEEKLAAAEELKNVQVVEGEPRKTTSIETAMEQKMEEELVRFLKTNSDVFSWTVHDLEGIDPEVMTHKLNVNPTFRPVR
ncbi:UNVERIFIED_CONTAM: hypothetical protein Slati_2459900 [Sesamum latifolium]|uniref:Retrotransposon gag domain-containing protein n=1 Tax=Sesamum latifolium TaxID=2727402 RepID=A0AAW2WEI2_9LAMI